MPCEKFISALEEIEKRAQQRQLWGQESVWLAELHDDWETWWQLAPPAEKAEIIACGRSHAEQEEFANELKAWAKVRYPDHPDVGDALLFQLSPLDPFCYWDNLQKIVSEADHTAIYSVAIPKGGKGCHENIWRLLVWLIPIKLGGELPNVVALKPINLRLDDPDARNAPLNAANALRATLLELAKYGVLAWLRRDWWKTLVQPANFGETPRTLTWLRRDWWKKLRWETALFWLLLFANLAWLLYFKMLPDQSLQDDAWVAQLILGFITIAGMLLLTLIWAIWYHWRAASIDLKAWIAMLDQSRILMAASHDSPRQPPIGGASYSLSLALSTWLALAHSRPAQSAFFRALLARLEKKAKEWLFTGVLEAGGTIGAVTHLVEKYNAAIDFNRTVPWPLVCFVRPEKDAQQNSNKDAQQNSNDEPSLPTIQVASRSAAALAGTPARSPEWLRFSSLSGLLFTRRNCNWLPQIVGVVLNWLLQMVGVVLTSATLVCAGLATVAALDLERMLRGSSVTALYLSPGGSADQMWLTVTIESQEADQFAAEITSDYWQSLSPRCFSKPESPNQKSSITFDLTINDHRNHPVCWVDIIRHRRLLWRDWVLEEEIIPARRRFEHPSTSQ